MRVLGIVTARGGSKSIPHKNIALLGGRPLLTYTADAVRDARLLTRTVLSTDDERIADIGRACGLDVPFMRPAELAGDETPTLPVLQHVVRQLEADGEYYDAVLTLQPTSPFREAADIDGSIELMERTKADSVVAYVLVGGKHPARMRLIDAEGRVMPAPFTHLFEGHRRQGWPTFYLCASSIYLTRRAVLMEQHSIHGADSRAWIVPEERACDIDTPFDLFMAEQLLRTRNPK